MERLSGPIEDRTDVYDVVVVGSGYGGAIAASRLARAGKRVCLLERGEERQPGEYPDTMLEMLDDLQVDTPDGHLGRRTAMFDMRRNDDLNALIGCGLGGTSLINANVSLKAEARVFDDPCWPKGLRDDRAGLEQGYERAVAMLAPTPYPQTSPVLPKLQALEEQARAVADAHFYRPPLNVTFEDRVNAAGVTQKKCTLCGDCVSGCNHGAKNTTLMNYLPDARRHGAEIFTGADVRRVERAGENWAVHYQRLQTGRETFGAPTEFVEAPVVVLGAGALGSTEILLRSKAAGLPLSDQVGKRVSGNGDVLAFAYNADREVRTVGMGEHPRPEPVGPCISGIADVRERPDLDDGMVIEEGSIPGGLAPALPELFATVAALEGREPGGLEAHIRDVERKLASLVHGARHGAMEHTQTFLVMAHDSSAGEMTLEDDRLRIHWPGLGEEAIFERVDSNLRAASERINATYLRDPIWTRLLGHELITVHPLGGCAMGDDATTGVTDDRGRVFSAAAGTDVHEGLYVTDGSVIPRSLGVNPLLTISALSERCAARLAADRGWQIDMGGPAEPQPVTQPSVGIQFTERMAGYVAAAESFAEGARRGQADGSPLEFVLTIRANDVERFVADPEHEAVLAGTVTAPSFSTAPLQVDGHFNLLINDPTQVATKTMNYRMRLTAEDGRTYWFDAQKNVHDDYGPDVWPDTTTLYVTLSEGGAPGGTVLARGILRIALLDFAKQMTTMRAVNATGVVALEAKARFGKLFAGALAEVYLGLGRHDGELDGSHPPRKQRTLRAPVGEVIPFTTSDGLTLRLTRYRAGDRGPVLLSHGLGVASTIFSLDTIDTNLLEYLCGLGFDVWLLDYRASITLPYAHTEFDVDDIATKDYPAAVAKVREVTGSDTIQVVAHCFGATTFTCAMLAGLQGVRSAVISQVSTDVVAPVGSKLKAGLHLPDVLATVGIADLNASAHDSFRDRVFNLAARMTPAEGREKCEDPTCERITFMYAPLYRHAQLNQATHDALHELFGVANMRSFEHLAAMIRSQHVVAFDGSEAYIPHLDRMAIPIAFVHGAENECFLPVSITRAIERLSAANGASLYTHHPIPHYGHIDCIFGRDAATDVFPLMAAHLEGAGA